MAEANAPSNPLLKRNDDVRPHVLKLLRAPTIEVIDEGGARLVLWLCEPFDFEYSFRDFLAQTMRSLSGPVSYQLPQAQSMEDFVEGPFSWAGNEFAVYFEHSLGYMQFSSASSAATRALLAALLPNLSFEQDAPKKAARRSTKR